MASSPVNQITIVLFFSPFADGRKKSNSNVDFINSLLFTAYLRNSAGLSA